VERRVAQPLVPLGMFRHRNLAVANVSGVLWAAAMFAWFFMSALYMQLVLHYTPMQVGLAFLPGNLIMAFMSLGASARIVVRWGIRGPFAAGLLIAATGLALFSRAPVDGRFFLDVLPAMVLLGIGAGIAFNPMLLAAMNDVPPEDAGLASGVVNTSFMMGGALGLAVLASVAAARSAQLQASGATEAIALNAGYRLAFLLGALFAAGTALLGWIALRQGGLGARAARGASAHPAAPVPRPRARP
jgi:MFS family permease